MKHRIPILLLLSALIWLLAACGQSSTPEPEATATPLPVVDVATPATDPSVTEITDAWERIQLTGKMVVGTSADYPPFESYNERYEITGFDPALIEIIGRNLGVEVELKDIAFDGLGAALQVGQVDAAIAAISVTDERDQYVDFSNVYYVSEDAILAADGATLLPIAALRDLASTRIGVQRGSVYEDLLEDNLVATGLMPSTNLFTYGDISRAVADLRAGLIDAVMLDKPGRRGIPAGGW
ncbi:MAG: amino acid ABC transporter substrate-binding protein, partial [Caldilineaceae bacterium]|nr:amino acid ABC transporter substrate-binding protein [Caldilineaceae bacterium]